MKSSNIFSFSLFLGILACTTVEGTHKSALLLTSESQENQMGVDAYQDILKKEHEANNPKDKAILVRVGQRLSSVAESRHHTNYNWEFKLIDSKQQNAFCLPGGKIVVYTGILPVMQNEAALAIVLGHEIAHATLRHAGQRMSQQMLIQGVETFTGSLISNPTTKKIALTGMGLAATGAIVLPFSRKDESEADSWGLEYAAQAGYDPREAPIFWERFAASSGGGGDFDLLSTHPANSKRIANLNSLQHKVMPLYEQSPKYGLGEKL